MKIGVSTRCEAEEYFQAGRVDSQSPMQMESLASAIREVRDNAEPPAVGGVITLG